MVVAWRPNGSKVAVPDVEQLDSELDRAAKSATEPLVVRMYDEDAADGAVLMIGVGGPQSFASWTEGDASWSSVGSKGSQGLAFSHVGDYTEIPPEALISNDAARECARQFLIGRVRPDAISWQRV
jgi:hypothetical protein